MKSRKKKIFGGFTLIELLVVIGILAVLLSITILAINPYEQIVRADDVSAKKVAQDFINTTQQYYASEKVEVWDKFPNCKSEFVSGKTLAQMPDCTTELTGGGNTPQSYTDSQQLKNIYVNICNNKTVLCYSPKSKIENQDAETKYNKFGVSVPGCPSADGSTMCYWCRPLNAEGNGSECSPSPTPTPTPTITPTPTPKYTIGPYALDDTKFLQTYAVLSYDYPAFPPNYKIDVSFRSDFGGTTALGGFGWFVNGVPVTTNADTVLWVAYAGDGNFFASWAADSIKRQQTDLTSKHFAFISMPFEWGKYVNGCGKNIYWRIVDAPTGGTGYTSTKFSQTYTNVIDCTTKVGVILNPQTWDDFNHDGASTYTDYIMGALYTKYRAGGWQPPE